MIQTEQSHGSRDQAGKQDVRVPQQRRAREKYDAIMRAAAQLLAEEGYSHTSTAKIAQLAGVSVGTVYAYFENKDAIFSAYVNTQIGEIFNTISGNLSALRYQSVEEAVRALITVSVTFTFNHRKTLSAMVGNIPGVYDGTMLEDVMQKLYVVAEMFYRAHGVTNDSTEARHITYTLTNSVTGFFVRMVTDTDIPLDKQEMIEELVTLIMGYFERRAARNAF